MTELSRKCRTGKHVIFPNGEEDVYIRTKEQLEQSHQAEEGIPVQYAGEKMQSTAEGIARKIGNEAWHTGKVSVRTLRQRGIKQKAEGARSDKANGYSKDEGGGQKQTRR